MAVLGQLATKDLMFSFTDLLFEFRTAFHTEVDITSLINAMDQEGMLEKKEKKLLECSDENAKKSFVYGKLYGDKSITPDSVVKLFEDTGNEQNVHFAKTLLSKLSSLQESAKTGQFTKCMLYLKNRSVNKWLPVNCCHYRVFCCSSLFICVWCWRSKMSSSSNILLTFTPCHS